MGSDIPMLARIWRWPRDSRPHGRRGCVLVTPKAAQDQVVAGAGTEFDPAVAEALGRAVRDGSFELTLPDLALPAPAAIPVPAAV